MSESGNLARLRWRCRRGMRELDELLRAFLDGGYASLGDDEKARFESLLMLPDPELAAYLLGRDEPPDRNLSPLIAAIRSSLRP